MNRRGDEINSPDLMEMKDTEKYQRQMGSKALVMTSMVEKKNYETAVRAVIEEKKRREAIEQRVNTVETQLNNLDSKLDKITDLLSTLLTNNKTVNNAD